MNDTPLSPEAEHLKQLKEMSDLCGLPLIEEDGAALYTPTAESIADANRKNRESTGITIDFPRLSRKDFCACGSEIEKYRSEIWKYCLWEGMPGFGVDVACGGMPCVPWALPYDLSASEYAIYNSNHKPRGPIALTGHAEKLPFEDGSLSFLCSSHWLEDTGKHEWPVIFTEWRRCLRSGGHLIVLVPEHVLWWKAVNERGQCHNHAHVQPEPSVGDMSPVARDVGFEVIEERLTSICEEDYSILGVFRKP